MHGTRYYVRAGNEVRGPVDEAQVARWLAQGLGGAEIGVPGSSSFVPLEQTPLARYLPSAIATRRKRRTVIGTTLLVLFVGVGARVIWARARDTERRIAEIQASLPRVGTVGVLAGSEPMNLCPSKGAFWGWPCGHGTIVPSGSHAQVMKADVFQVEGLCRYWVKDGATAGAAGDGPCAWMRAAPP